MPKFTLPDLHWIDIPAGKVTLQEDYSNDSYIKRGQKQTFDVPAFAIAKYPVTNKQYAEYVNETGKSQDIVNDPMQPVIGMTWYDAIAFCEWLSQKSGTKILLPTEQQWQRAAQGDEGRVYPWGNQWDASRCNNAYSRIGKMTPVTAYEGKGDSPYGVVDMSGNVYEWCLTEWKSGVNNLMEAGEYHVLRSGSFHNGTHLLRSAYRSFSDPRYGRSRFGFRCVVSVPVP